ncbi:Oxidoreductase family, NAD-binding Rossmann fold protein [Verrucomicrobiia bacterium DG1235]|nr:Oxidoreductase family, NAD-binding Rossmann fold protein [Verrucomicrobiae bacterium DG1235]
MQPGEFVFAAAHFDHGHIYGQIDGIASAGGTLKYVFDTQDGRVDSVLEKYPGAKRVSSFDAILDDDEVKLVTAAAIPNERCGLGIRIMDSGKDYLTDKAPFTTLDQLALAKAKAEETGRKYAVCYSERLLCESAYYAGEVARSGRIGRVLQVLNLAPHNLAAQTRPEWFFQKEKFGGILTDIGSHQFEQFLYCAGANDAEIKFARVENFANASYPEFEDFGEASAILDNGASCYCRLDWFNPKGSQVWGDGRTFILGEKGYIEARKYRDIVRGEPDVVYIVDDEGEERVDCAGKVGFPFFGKFVLDCLNRTENAMTQAHAFKAAELAMQAQVLAEKSQ